MKIFADIGIGPAGNLETTARILGEILHVNFEADADGRYDEFPAYIADSDGARYALLGTPNPEDDLREEPTNEFQLMIRPVMDDHRGPKKDISHDIVSRISGDGRIDSWVLK